MSASTAVLSRGGGTPTMVVIDGLQRVTMVRNAVAFSMPSAVSPTMTVILIH